MADPQPTDAHLRIAHRINEEIMASDFSKRQRKILDLVLRLSWGCGKKFAIIPKQKDFELVGVGQGHIKQELTVLVRDRVIFNDGGIYGFNKDYDQWRISRAVGYSEKKVTDLVRLNINGNNPQLTKVVSEILPKWEESTYQSGKSDTPTVASSKEKERKIKKEDTDKYIKGTYGHMVQR